MAASMRALMPLMFQVAIFMRLYRHWTGQSSNPGSGN
jgi:hypothetical protein